MSLLRRIQHPNIVRVIASYEGSPPPPFPLKLRMKQIIVFNFNIALKRVVDIYPATWPSFTTTILPLADASNMYMLEELCTGGELWCKVKKEHVKFSEDDVKKVMRKTLSAICYMHEEGMCHRDLKLENFLLEYDSPDAEIKVSYHCYHLFALKALVPFQSFCISIVIHCYAQKKICDLGMSLINNGKHMHQRSGTIE